VAILALCGCGTAIENAHKAVTQALGNPSGIRFTNVRTTDQGNVCGQVKVREASGAYGGYRSYAAIRSGNEFRAVVDEDGNNPVVRETCGTAEEQAMESRSTATSAEVAGQRWEVRIVPGSNMGALTDMAARLVENGFVANFSKQDGKTVVYLGPFDTQQQAQDERARLMASRGIESIVMPHPEP